MKSCVKCGADLQDYDEVCSCCGEKNPGEMPSANSESQRGGHDRKVRLSAKVAAIVIMVAIGIAFLFLSSPKRPEWDKEESVMHNNKPAETQESVPQDAYPSENEDSSVSSSEAALEHNWVLSADGSGLECSQCGAIYATQVLEISNFDLGQGYNPGSGFGLNDNGEPVYWQIRIELLNISANHVEFISCSWDDSVISVNNKTSIGDIYDDYGWEAVNGGHTLWRSFFDYEQRQFAEIMLPDDKTIEGRQWVAVIGRKDDTMYLRKITFDLIYDGNYKDGTGWSITNISWS